MTERQLFTITWWSPDGATRRVFVDADDEAAALGLAIHDHEPPTDACFFVGAQGALPSAPALPISVFDAYHDALDEGPDAPPRTGRAAPLSLPRKTLAPLPSATLDRVCLAYQHAVGLKVEHGVRQAHRRRASKLARHILELALEGDAELARRAHLRIVRDEVWQPDEVSAILTSSARSLGRPLPEDDDIPF